jgi:hypothetical protein
MCYDITTRRHPELVSGSPGVLKYLFTGNVETSSACQLKTTKMKLNLSYSILIIAIGFLAPILFHEKPHTRRS